MNDNDDFEYKVNPCSACLKKYDIKDINNINQCCYDTYAAFAGASSINNIRNLPEAENCKKCVENSKIAMGKDPCEFRLTAYPVWTQSAHYFPEIFSNVKNINKSRDMCINLCRQGSNMYKNECIQNCITDSNAIELYKKEEKKLKEKYVRENFEEENDEENDENTNNYLKGVNLTQFYISFIIGLIIFMILLGIFLKTLLK